LLPIETGLPFDFLIISDIKFIFNDQDPVAAQWIEAPLCNKGIWAQFLLLKN